jgi:hypothetical protein
MYIRRLNENWSVRILLEIFFTNPSKYNCEYIDLDFSKE